MFVVNSIVYLKSYYETTPEEDDAGEYLEEGELAVVVGPTRRWSCGKERFAEALCLTSQGLRWVVMTQVNAIKQ